MSGRIVACLVRGLIHALALLPLDAARRLADAVAAVGVRLRVLPVRVAEANLGLCRTDLSQKERRRLAAESFRQTARLGFESGVVWYWPRDKWQKLLVSCKGEAAVDADLAAGHGVLLLVPHYGNWEYLSLHLGAHFGVTALYDPPRIDALEPLVRHARERSGAELLPISRAGVRAVFERLSTGGAVALLPDQVPDDGTGGVFAPVFGVNTLTMTFAHRLIKRTGARCYLCSATRVSAGFEILYEPAPDAIYDGDPVVHATAMNQAIERIVMRQPAQYQWEYKRFKRQPPGQPKAYPKGM